MVSMVPPFLRDSFEFINMFLLQPSAIQCETELQADNVFGNIDMR